MVESKAAVIELPDEQRAVVELALAYLYTGKVEVDSGAAALELARLADKWQLTHLAARCLTHLDRNFARKGKEAAAAWAILGTAELLAEHMPEAARLTKTCVSTILRSPCPPLSVDRFGQASVGILLARERLPVALFPDEDAVARFACAWLSTGEARASAASSILDQVQWRYCTEAVVAGLVSSIPSLAPSIAVAVLKDSKRPTRPRPRQFVGTICQDVWMVGDYFGTPKGMAVDGEGRIIVVDRSYHRIQAFADDGSVLAEWGRHGFAPGQFNHPRGVAVDGEGRVVVADADNHRIQIFDGISWCAWGSEGSGDGQFFLPRDVAVDGEGRIIVADWGNNRIQVFAADGTFLAKWGCVGTDDGQFVGPSSVVVDGEGRVVVADTDNDRIQVFSAGGAFLAKWGSRGAGDGQFDLPAGVAIDGQGRIIVADTNNHRVQIFAADGTFLAKRGGEGYGDGQFRCPTGVVVDREGRIIVADTANHRLQVFGADWAGC
jgi:hypothetical protein